MDWMKQIEEKAKAQINEDFKRLWSMDHYLWMYRATGDRKYLDMYETENSGGRK